VFIYPHTSLARSKSEKQKIRRPLVCSLKVLSMQVLTDSSLITSLASSFSSPSFSWTVYLVVFRRKTRHGSDLKKILSSAEGREQTSISFHDSFGEDRSMQTWKSHFWKQRTENHAADLPLFLVKPRRIYGNEERRRGPEDMILYTRFPLLRGSDGQILAKRAHQSLYRCILDTKPLSVSLKSWSFRLLGNIIGDKQIFE